MHSGIFYLYEYNDNRRLRNVGFLKLSSSRAACEIQLRAQGVPVSRGDTLDFCAFCMEESSVVTRTVAEIPCETHRISAHLTFPREMLSCFEAEEPPDGFLLRLPNGSLLAAVSPDVVPDFRNLREFSPVRPEPAEVSTAPGEDIGESSGASVEDTDESSAASEEEPAGSSAAPEKDADVPKEEPPETKVLPSQPEVTGTEYHEESTEAPARRGRDIRKIRRSDLSSLPKKCWYLANNSFLLHGYYNYGHLLLIEENGHFWLGVPGIYDSREARAAELFGFPQFNDSYNGQVTLSADECSSYGKFGYWFHYIY